MKGKRKMEGFYPMLFGIPIANIERDIKDGKYILESKGTVSGNIHAQTVVVYGNISGNIKADEVVLINGKCTGNIHADTVVGLEQPQKKKKNCQNCKYYDPTFLANGDFWLCPKASYRYRTDFKFCDNYKEKESSIKEVDILKNPMTKYGY